MRVLAGVVTFLVLCSASVAGAETRQRLHASGYWAAYRAQDVVIEFNRRRHSIAVACIAETRVRNGTLQLILFGNHQLVTQVSSPGWSFRRRTATMKIDWGNTHVVYGDAEYFGAAVRHWGADTTIDMARILMETQGEEGYVTVRNQRDDVIAQFLPNGFVAAIKRAQSCASRL
jgi:hypothetical protein